MAKLYFKVEADYEKVKRLREECQKLQEQLKGMDASSSPDAVRRLEEQLHDARTEMTGLASEAAKAGAQIEHGFKSKIFQASTVVNELSEKIIDQKAAVRKASEEAKGLGEAYREALKNRPSDADGLLERFKAAKKALAGEKDALFDMTQEQARARLAVKKLRDEYHKFEGESDKMTAKNKENTDSFEGLSFSMKKAIGIIGGAAALKKLGEEIVRVRGEFQEMETTIETMVGKNVASKLLPQIKELAKISPLTMSDIVGAEQMMLGFNIQAEDTMKYLKALSDLSMGSSTKFNSLTLAFSQMSAAGKLMGQDLNQMINAGFNPLQVIAEKTGKSIATLKEEMSKGAVSAEMVQQAFIDATSEGGKFFKMSENASKTINGQLSMMEDAMDAAFNEIGKASEGFIIKSISGVTTLIENYEKVGKVLVGLIATYGAYKTALFSVTAMEKANAVVRLASIKHISALSAATGVLTKKIGLLNLVMKANPYALVASILTGLVATMWALHDSTTAAEKAQRGYNKALEDFDNRESERKDKINSLISIIQDKTETDFAQVQAYEELRRLSPALTAAYTREKLAVASLADAHKEVNKERDQFREQDAIDNINELTDRIKELKKRRDELYTMPNTGGAVDVFTPQIDLAEEELKRWQNDLEKLKSLKKQAEEESKPVEVRLMEAKTDLKQIQDEFDKAKKKLEEEQKKLQDNPFYVISIPVKLQYDSARINLKKQNDVISGLEAIKESDKKDNYKKAFDDAKEAWENAKKKLQEIEKDKGKFTQKQYQTAKQLVESTKSAFKALGGDVSVQAKKDLHNFENKKKEIHEQQKRIGELEEKFAKDNASLQKDNERNAQRMRIEAMEDGQEKIAAKREYENRVELEDIERQKKNYIERMIHAQKEIFDAREKLKEKQNPSYRAKTFDSNSVKVDTSIFDDMTQNVIKRQNLDEIKSQQDAMNEYLKVYGTMMEKKEAITKEYNAKIAKASTEGEKLTLGKQLEEALASVDMDALEKSLDWSKVFSNLGKISENSLKELKDKLQRFVQETKGLSVESKKEIIESIDSIDKELSTRSPFKSFGDSMSVLKDTTLELKKAQDEYNKALKEGTKEEQTNAKETLNAARDKKRAAQIKATEDLHSMSEKMGEYSEIGHSALSLVETLGVKPPEWMKDFMNGFDSILGGLNEIDLTKPMSIITGSIDALTGALQTVFSLGGVIDFNGSNAKEVQKTMDRLTDRNKLLQQSIEDLTDEIKVGKGLKTVDAYKQAVENQKETNENYLEMAKAQAGYHNHHHSWDYYWEGFTKEQMEWIKKNIKESFNGDLFSLTPEEMKKLRSNVDIWASIQNTGKGGYGERLTDKLDEYIEQAEKIGDLTDQLYTSLTSISFDGMYDSFIDKLMDMKYSAEDAAEDISEYFMRAMLSNQVGEMFSDKLKGWWEKFGKAMENDGTLDDTERQSLLDEYLQYVKDATKLRDELAKATGYDKIGNSYKQEASSKGFTTMSQEQGEEMTGRFTAMYESDLRRESIQNELLEVVKNRIPITQVRGTVEMNDVIGLQAIADDTRDILANSYVELQQIRENTEAIIKPIKQMQKDMEEVKRNTDRL